MLYHFLTCVIICDINNLDLNELFMLVFSTLLSKIHKVKKARGFLFLVQPKQKAILKNIHPARLI
jgi:hypothetical protein